MSVLDVLSVVSAAAAVISLAKQLLDYRKYKKRRSSIETSLLLRKIVLSNGHQLASLETRDSALRRVLITPSELDSSESVRRNYELLLEKDLSQDHLRIQKLVEQLNSQEVAIDSFEEAIGGKQRTTAWKIVNAGLISAAIASRLSDLGKDRTGGSSILGLMLGRRMDVYARAYAYSFATLAAGLAFHFLFSETGVTLLSITVPAILLIGLNLNQRLLQFRVSRGYFGNNASEAAEFIRFIQSHSNKADFSDGDGMRRLLPAQEREQSEKVVFVGQGVTA